MKNYIFVAVTGLVFSAGVAAVFAADVAKTVPEPEKSDAVKVHASGALAIQSPRYIVMSEDPLLVHQRELERVRARKQLANMASTQPQEPTVETIDVRDASSAPVVNSSTQFQFQDLTDRQHDDASVNHSLTMTQRKAQVELLRHQALAGKSNQEPN